MTAHASIDTMPTRTVRLDGDVTIQSAADVKVRVMAALDGEMDVEIDLSGVTELDTAGLQVMFLARREASHLGVEFRLTDPSDAVLDVLSTVGLDCCLRAVLVSQADVQSIVSERGVA